MTLKEAVESGRRWKHKTWSAWIENPMPEGLAALFDVRQLIGSDFEIEPGPEKPREWIIHSYENGYIHGCKKTDHACHEPIRVHDADACDRLKAKICTCDVCLQGMAGGGPGR